MQKSIKRSLIVIALALFACLVVLVLMLRPRPDEMDEPDELLRASVSKSKGGPSFELRVVMPRAGLPLGGILPDWFVQKFDGTPRELRFDYTNPGARIVSVGQDRLELRAHGWELLIEADGEGRVASGTHLVFPLGLGGNKLRLNCRPADPANGLLRTATRPGSNELNGRFLVELARCKNAESGKTSDWPPSPLTLRGTFAGLPLGGRQSEPNR
jgi:hypothetical protein